MQQIGFYCKTYCPLNMFRAPLCPSSGAQELYRWLLLVVHGSVKIENVIKVGEYWCVVSIMLLCVICVCLTLSNPIFLPTVYPQLLFIYPCHFPTSTTARIKPTITCSHQNTWPAKKQKEYNLHYLLAKVRTT